MGKGLEIIEGLRGHTSGYAVPQFIVDAPGGGGKIPVMPNYLVSYSDHKVILRNYEGYITTYEEPSDYQPHDQANCQYCQNPRPEPGQEGISGLLDGKRMWIEPAGFAAGPRPRRRGDAPPQGPGQVGAAGRRGDRGDRDRRRRALPVLEAGDAGRPSSPRVRRPRSGRRPASSRSWRPVDAEDRRDGSRPAGAPSRYVAEPSHGTAAAPGPRPPRRPPVRGGEADRRSRPARIARELRGARVLQLRDGLQHVAGQQPRRDRRPVAQDVAADNGVGVVDPLALQRRHELRGALRQVGVACRRARRARCAAAARAPCVAEGPASGRRPRRRRPLPPRSVAASRPAKASRPARAPSPGLRPARDSLRQRRGRRRALAHLVRAGLRRVQGRERARSSAPAPARPATPRR